MNTVRATLRKQETDDARAGLDTVQLLHLLEQAEHRVETLRRSERLQQALYAIADLAGGSLDTQDMLRRIHAIVGELMYAENCYIELLHRAVRRSTDEAALPLLRGPVGRLGERSHAQGFLYGQPVPALG